MNLTFKDVFMALWRSMILIIASALLCMAVMSGFTFLFVSPEYTSEAKLYVYNEKNDEKYITSGDLTVSKSLVDTYLIIIRSDPVLEEVARRLKGTYPDITAKSINKMLSGSAINETEAFFISATGTNRQMTADIVNTIVDVAPDEIIRVVKAASVEVIEEAKVPEIDDYSWPITRNALVGFLVGFILSCAFVLIAHSSDTTVYGRTEIIENFKLSILGIIPPQEENFTKRKGTEAGDTNYGFIINQNTSFAVAEAYRMARTNIFYLPTESVCKKIVVTSAVASEGKSTSAINISKVLAQAGKKVLLIDADMRRPKISKYLGIEQQEGLSEYLAGITEVISVVHSEESGIDVIVSGNSSSSAAELLATSKIELLLREYSDRYDYIIVDTPPVNIVTDATVLANKVDGYILNIRAGFSDVNEIKQTVRALEQVDAKILGIMLEDVDPKIEMYGKYSRYGKYGKYGKYGRYGRYGRYYKEYYGKQSKYRYYTNSIDRKNKNDV